LGTSGSLWRKPKKVPDKLGSAGMKRPLSHSNLEDLLPPDAGGSPKDPSSCLGDRKKSEMMAERAGHLPHTPELCGLQAILPRQCGVRILEKLGEGTFGKVVLAVNRRNTPQSKWDERLERGKTTRKLCKFPMEGEKVVLKCVKKQRSGQEECRWCMEREVRIHGVIEHPNIVKFFGHYDNGEFLTLILGFIEGQELHGVLCKERRFEEHKARLVCVQIARAIDALHKQGIVHRDLNPHNVLVTPMGGVVIIDLGLALCLAEGDCVCKEGQLIGTNGYIAPEIYLGTACGPKADVFSFGVLMYECHFGFRPFNSPSEVISTAVEFPDPSWGMATTDEARELIERCLRKQPDDRIASLDAMLHPWFTIQVLQEADALLGAPQAEAPTARDDNSHVHSSPTRKTWEGEDISLPEPLTPQVGPTAAPGERPPEAKLALTIDGVHGPLFPPLEPVDEADLPQALSKNSSNRSSEHSTPILHSLAAACRPAAMSAAGGDGAMDEGDQGSSVGRMMVTPVDEVEHVCRVASFEYFVATVQSSTPEASPDKQPTDDKGDSSMIPPALTL